MLILETLPGWPEAPEFSSLFMWVLMVLGPAAVLLVIALLVMAPGWARRGQQPENTDVVVRSDD